MLSPVRLSSVTFVRPTQRVVIFGNISTPWPSVDIHGKFYGGRLRGTHPCNNINATLSNTKNRTMLSTKSNVASTLLPLLATILNDVSSFLNFTKNSFDIVGKTGKNGNIVAKKTATMSKKHSTFVERTKFYDKLVRHCCRFWQQSRIFFRQSRTLLQHCCWCGRGFKFN